LCRFLVMEEPSWSLLFSLWDSWFNNFTTVSSLLWSGDDLILFFIVIVISIDIVIFQLRVILTIKCSLAPLLTVLITHFLLARWLIIFVLQLFQLCLDNVYVGKFWLYWKGISNILCLVLKCRLFIQSRIKFIRWLEDKRVWYYLGGLLVISTLSPSTLVEKLTALRQVLVLDLDLVLQKLLRFFHVAFVHFSI